jgi:NADH-ubiquinone oxidoreductase chain 5
MAAPTPVSALVHSSTLVTAGIYLVFRFRPITLTLASSHVVLMVGLLTLLLAGLRAIYETDIKKIVALSTLRQLGFILCRISIFFYLEAFIHLITHAFFKALLFITVGNIIHLSDDYQDLRKITFTGTNFSFTFTFIIIANLRLRGFPFLRGFFSKELILESLTGEKTPLVPLAIIYLFIFGCTLTAAYSARFIIARSIN